MIDNEALIDFADLAGIFTDFDALGQGAEAFGDIESSFGVVEHGSEVELRFAEHDAWIGAQLGERILAHDTEALHGGGMIGIATKDDRVGEGTLSGDAGLRRWILRKRWCGNCEKCEEGYKTEG
jgi:hypothetical protein